MLKRAHLVRDSIHVSRIKFTTLGIDEVISGEQCVPSIDEVDGNIVSCFQIAV